MTRPCPNCGYEPHPLGNIEEVLGDWVEENGLMFDMIEDDKDSPHVFFVLCDKEDKSRCVSVNWRGQTDDEYKAALLLLLGV